MRGIGYAINYRPDCREFVIRGINIYGQLYGTESTDEHAELRIVDENFEFLYFSTFPHTLFTEEANWVLIDVPDIVTDKPFYVLLQTNSPKSHGIRISYDSSSNKGSKIITGWQLADWSNYLGSIPNNRYGNWMIRIIGASTDASDPITWHITDYMPIWTFEEVVGALDTPKKLSQWMVKNITSESWYEREKKTGVIYNPSPEETFETRSGNCRVFAVFACYILQHHGYEAEILTIKVASDERKNHVVCVYTNSNGSFYTINNGQLQGPFQTYEDIAFDHHPDWSKYTIHHSWEDYQKSKGPDKTGYR